MKTVLILGLATALVLAGMNWRENYRYEEAWNPENLIRLHVSAHSDEDEDQEVKLKVRDVVLEELSPVLRDMENVNEARSYLTVQLPELERRLAALPVLSGRSVEVELLQEWFPHRTYGELALPQGEYQALRVNIGRGQGANWWCLLFPPLCLVDAAVDYEELEPNVGVHLLTEEELSQVPTRVRWALWEYLKGLRWWSASWRQSS